LDGILHFNVSSIALPAEAWGGGEIRPEKGREFESSVVQFGMEGDSIGAYRIVGIVPINSNPLDLVGRPSVNDHEARWFDRGRLGLSEPVAVEPAVAAVARGRASPRPRSGFSGSFFFLAATCVVSFSPRSDRRVALAAWPD